MQINNHVDILNGLFTILYRVLYGRAIFLHLHSIADMHAHSHTRARDQVHEFQIGHCNSIQWVFTATAKCFKILYANAEALKYRIFRSTFLVQLDDMCA